MGGAIEAEQGQSTPGVEAAGPRGAVGAKGVNISEEASVDDENSKQAKIILHLLMLYTFLSATFKDGFGPLVSVYLVVSQGWSPGKAGILWFIRDASALVFSSFVGAFIDKVNRKRLLLVGATITSSIAATSIAWTQNFSILCGTSFIGGAAISLIQPAKTAMVLGIVTQEKFDESAKAVEICDHFGSLVIISLAGVVGYFSWPGSLENIFFIIGVGGLVSAISLVFMPLNENDEEEEEDMLDISLHSLSRSIHRSVNNLMEEETRIDHASSRNLAQGEKPSSRQSVICEKNMLIYAASCFFFHLGNCAILPLLSQVMALDTGRAGIPYTCGNVGIAQLTSIFATVAMGKSISSGHGYKVSVITGYFVGVPLRCLTIIALVIYKPNVYALMATQVLDGIGAGIFGLSLPIYTKHLTAGTGHFAFMMGLLGSVTMTAGALSNLLSGLIVDYTSYPVGFVFLGVCGLAAALLLYLVSISPTNKNEEGDSGDREGRVTTEKDEEEASKSDSLDGVASE